MAFSAYELRMILSASDHYSSAFRRLNSDLRGVERMQARLTKQNKILTKSIKDLGDAPHLFTPGRAAYDKQLASMNTQLAKQVKLQEKITKYEIQRSRLRGISHSGKIAAYTGGFGLAAAGGLSQYAANFENQLTLAATQTPGTQGKGVGAVVKNVEKLRPEILKLMKDFGTSSEDLTKSAYDIYSSIRLAGTAPEQFAQGLDFMRLSSMAAVGGLTSLDTATKATIILANQFGSDISTVSKNLDTAFAIVRFGNMTFEQFTSMLTKVGSAAARAGFSLQDVGGIMAMLTKKSGKPDEAATWIDRMLQTLQTPEFIKGMRLLHAPIDRDGKLKSLNEVMEQILRLGVANRGRGGLGMQNIIPYITSVGKHGVEGGAGLRSTIQAQRGLTFSLQDIKALKQAQNDIMTDQGEFLRSFNAVYNQAGMKWNRLMAGFKAGALELGIAVLPAMTKVVGKVLELVTWFGNLEPSTRRTIGQLIVLGSTIAFVAGVLAPIITAAVQLTLYLRLMGGSAAILGAPGGGLAMMAVRLTRIGIIATALIGILAGLKAVFDEFTQNNVEGNLLQKGIRGIAKFQQGALNMMPDFIKDNDFGQVKWLLKLDEFILDSETLSGTASPKVKKKVEDAFSKYNKLVKDAQKAMGKQQKADFAKQIQESRDAINEVLRQTTSGMNETERAASDRARQVVEEQKRILDEASQGLQQAYTKIKEANQKAFGELFAGPVGSSGLVAWRKQFGVGMSMDQMIQDLKMQTTEFAAMRQRFATLRKKGFDADVISELQALGAEGSPFVKAMILATPKQVKQYNALMATKKKDITAATEIDFDAQVAKWRSFGTKTALAMINGMEDAQIGPKMDALAKSWFGSLAKGMAEAVVALQSGPTVTPGSLPAPYGPVGAGVAYKGRYHPSYRPAKPPIGHGPGGAGTRHTAGMGDTHFHVSGTFHTPEQTMNAALRMAAFKTRNRRTR